MSTSRHPDNGNVSVFEYAMLEERDDERLELMRGRVVRESAPGGVHGRVLLALLSVLVPHVRARSLGLVLVETGVRYPGEPATVRRPDIGFIAASRLPSVTPLSFWEVIPDLMIEILSPTDRRGAVQDKIASDLDAGVRQVWILDPRKRCIIIHTSGGAPRVVADDDTLDAGDVVAGFVLRVRDLFAEID
jgi:Uma2 family endonuclease